jgi:hypothetical protein
VEVNCVQLVIFEFRIWDKGPLNIVYLHAWYWKRAVHGYCSISVLFPPQILSLLSIPHWSAGIRRALRCDSHPEGSLWAWGLSFLTGGLYCGVSGGVHGVSDGEFGQHTFGVLPSNPQWNFLRNSMASGFGRDDSCLHSVIGTHWPPQPPVLLPP